MAAFNVYFPPSKLETASKPQATAQTAQTGSRLPTKMAEMGGGDSSATLKLADLLRHSEDLDKISTLKAEFTRKKAAIDGQLRHGLQEQLAVTQLGMTSISNGATTIDLIKAEMIKIDKLCAEAQMMIKDFPHVNMVAQAQRNFSAVEKMKGEVETFDRQLALLEDMLREDDQDLENQPNLLKIHYELTRLRDVRDDALDQARNDGEAAEELINNLRLPSGATLQEYFGRLAEVIEWFDDHVGQACMNLIPLVQSGNNGLIVRLALIVEEEEKNDKKAKALQDARQDFKELASRFKSITTGKREVRGYKEKFLKAIELAAEAQIDQSNQAFQEDPDKLEKSVRWYFNDLHAVKLGMVSLMPKKWKIYQTYVNIYHKLMHDWLVACIDDPACRPPQLLAILNWVEKYYSKMRKLGVPDEQMRPHVIDDRGPEIVREYRQLIIKAVDEWMDRMGKTDSEVFKRRDEDSLDRVEDNSIPLHTKTLSDMWRMLREQLEVAGSSERHDISEGVVDAMFKALKTRQHMWEQLVDDELRRWADPSNTAEGFSILQDWLIALANDQISCIDDAPTEPSGQPHVSYLSRFATDIQPLVSPEYFTSSATTQLDSLRDGYVDLSTHCLSIFASLICTVDFRTLLPEFFTQAWYAKKGMGQIISTFDDYLKDYIPMLHSTLPDTFAEALADELLTRYLSCVHNKSVKFRRQDPFVDKIRDDLVTVFQFFEQFESTFASIKEKWKVVAQFLNLLEAEKTQVVVVFEEFKREYPDLGMGWVEATLRCRDDFERAMVNGIKAKAAGMEVVRGVETIMGKVK